ncbi:MAG: acetylxylan esterase [Candidatus Firestonebacteria bacterium]
MESFGDYIAGYYDVKDQLPHYLRAKAEGMIASEEKEKENIKTIKDFEERRRKLKAVFIESIGGLPGKRTPLNAAITGKIERDGYLIEKVIFESQPEYFVTSNLYIPKHLKGQAPAVLFVSGHALEAKAYPVYQKVCIDLVKNGFIVLAIDPLGQGERLQYYNNRKKNTDVRWGTREHSYSGFQCILSGAGLARYFIGDGMRGLDYLLSRKEVDGAKIGVTGNSGGGTLTSYLTFLDERIKCSVPCSYVTSRLDYFKTGQAHDAEQNVFGVIKNGINYDDLVTGIAPLPLLIGANAYDFFCIEGAVKTLEKARRIYALYKAEDKISMTVSNTTHQYSDELRQAAVNWFKVHLKNEKPDFVTEADIKTEDPSDLNCTACGQVLAQFPDSETVYSLNRKYAEAVFPERSIIKDGKSLVNYINNTTERLSNLLPFRNKGEKIYPRIIEVETIKELGCTREFIFFFSEQDIAVTGYLLKPDRAEEKLKSYILVTEEGTSGFEKQKPLIKRLLKKGFAVFLFDPRGVGGVSSRSSRGISASRMDFGIYDSEFRINYDAIMMGTSVLACRVFDITRAFDYLETREDLDKNNIGLIGRRAAGIWALFSGVLQPKIRSIVIEDTVYSFKNIAETRLFAYDNKILLHGILKKFDIVDLIPCFSGRKICLIKLKNAEQKPVNNKIINLEFMSILKKYYGSAEFKRKELITQCDDLLDFKYF